MTAIIGLTNALLKLFNQIGNAIFPALIAHNHGFLPKSRSLGRLPVMNMEGWNQGRRPIALALVAIVLTAMTGCSTFQKEWRVAKKEAVHSEDLAGCWSGRWVSEVNHHNGKLKCVMRRQEDGRYLARYHATFGFLFRFTYAVPLTAQRNATNWTFSGSADLGGLAGGEYHYDGEAGPTNFVSRYRSARDRGTFQMKRVWPHD